VAKFGRLEVIGGWLTKVPDRRKSVEEESSGVTGFKEGKATKKNSEYFRQTTKRDKIRKAAAQGGTRRGNTTRTSTNMLGRSELKGKKKGNSRRDHSLLVGRTGPPTGGVNRRFPQTGRQHDRGGLGSNN